MHYDTFYNIYYITSFISKTIPDSCLEHCNRFLFYKLQSVLLKSYSIYCLKILFVLFNPRSRFYKEHLQIKVTFCI